MKYAIVMCVLLSGCAIGGRPYVEQYEKLSAQLIADMREYQCRGMRIGPWLDIFGASPDMAQAWRTMCASSGKQLPVKTEQ